VRTAIIVSEGRQEDNSCVQPIESQGIDILYKDEKSIDYPCVIGKAEFQRPRKSLNFEILGIRSPPQLNFVDSA
jgi:hypothetical protein